MEIFQLLVTNGSGNEGRLTYILYVPGSVKVNTSTQHFTTPTELHPMRQQRQDCSAYIQNYQLPCRYEYCM